MNYDTLIHEHDGFEDILENQLFSSGLESTKIKGFIDYLTDWKRNGEKIRKICEAVFCQNDIEANFVLRSFGGFSYNASCKTVFSCPKAIMSERPRFIKEEYVNEYIACCLLHETGHHMQSLKTTLIEDRLELLRMVEDKKICKSNFYDRYIEATMTIEIDAWNRSERLTPPFPLNKDFFNNIKAYSLSTYCENLGVEAGIFYELFSPKTPQNEMVLS